MSNIERVIRATLPAVPKTNYFYPTPDLMDLTKEGWEVVERFDVDEVIQTSEQVLSTMNQNGYQSPPTTVMHEHIGKQAYFRLRKGGEIVIGELSEEISRLKLLHESDLRKIGELDQAAKKLETELTKVRASLESSYESNEVIRRQKDQIEQIKRQLEGDIGKIREHVGKKTMGEILGDRKI